MLETLCQIGTFLKGVFTLKRNSSPNFDASAKNQSQAAVTAGHHSLIQQARTIINGSQTNINGSQTNVSAIAHAEALDKLIKCFSKETCERIIDQILDPKMKVNLKNCNGQGWQRWLLDQFLAVPMSMSDPKANNFIAIKKNALESLNSFIETKNDAEFRKAWASCGEFLLKMRDE